MPPRPDSDSTQIAMIPIDNSLTDGQSMAVPEYSSLVCRRLKSPKMALLILGVDADTVCHSREYPISVLPLDPNMNDGRRFRIPVFDGITDEILKQLFAMCPCTRRDGNRSAVICAPLCVRRRRDWRVRSLMIHSHL